MHKLGLAQPPSCDCGQRQTMNHVVDTCPLAKFEGGLNVLHEADDDSSNVLDGSARRRHLANTTDRSWRRRRCGLSLPLLQRLANYRTRYRVSCSCIPGVVVAGLCRRYGDPRGDSHGCGYGMGKVLKVKFSHTRYRALGPELIPVYRQSARR